MGLLGQLWDCYEFSSVCKVRAKNPVRYMSSWKAENGKTMQQCLPVILGRLLLFGSEIFEVQKKKFAIWRNLAQTDALNELLKSVRVICLFFWRHKLFRKREMTQDDLEKFHTLYLGNVSSCL